MRSASSLKVIYSLRPAKQIERRMLIDALQILAEGGFRIREYQYTGMGSLYFVDFVLFHKLLGIRNLVSVEFDERLADRVHFNCPFDLIDVKIDSIGDVIPTLETNKKHLLWLDYDFRLNRMVVEDVAAAAYRLPPGSILLITVDVKPPPGDGPKEWRSYYEDQAGDYLSLGWTDEVFGESLLPSTNAQILLNVIGSGMAPGVQFYPLFNFLYADGHPMLTVGGVLGTQVHQDAIGRCDFSRTNYLRTDLTAPPYEIVVPRLTHKERLHIDRFMPCADGWTPGEFEVTVEDMKEYREIYRFYPSYVEMLV
jgi:hypothetical protein